MEYFFKLMQYIVLLFYLFIYLFIFLVKYTPVIFVWITT